jgi:BON domain
MADRENKYRGGGRYAENDFYAHGRPIPGRARREAWRGEAQERGWRGPDDRGWRAVDRGDWGRDEVGGGAWRGDAEDRGPGPWREERAPTRGYDPHRRGGHGYTGDEGYVGVPGGGFWRDDRRGADERHEHEDWPESGRHRGRGPRGYTRSDERIREDVSDRLTDDPALDASDIEVSVAACEVTLGGHVESRWAKRRAEDLAETVSGVRHVQNNLRVRARAEDAIQPSGGGRPGSG